MAETLLMRSRIALGLCVCVPLLAADTPRLSFRPVAADYSKALDRIVFVSAGPNQLHIFNPITQHDTAVTLPLAPTSVSVSPNGLYAAVGHDARISYVNLVTAAVEKIFTVTINVQAVVLSSDYVHIPPDRSIRISTGVETTSNAWGYNGSGARLHPSGKAIYSTRDGVSPNDLHKYDVSTGPITGGYDSIYHGDHPVCGGVWYSDDGARIFTGCGSVFRYSELQSEDMRYAGGLSDTPLLRSLAYSGSLRKIAVVPEATTIYWPTQKTIVDTEVQVYETDYLGLLGRLTIPRISVGANTFTAHGRNVFFNANASMLFVVAQAPGSSSLLNDYAVFAIQLNGVAPGCTIGLSATTASPSAVGGAAAVNVTTGAECIFQASTNTPWIVLSSGAFGSGNTTLSYRVRSNPTTSPRTGTITVDDKVLTITQAAGTGIADVVNILPYRPVDAEYSKQLDRVVLVSAGPNELHIYNPVSGADTAVSLAAVPTCVSVSPDGTFAAVGHNAKISYVNLNTATVVKVLDVSTSVLDIVLAGNGYVYAFPMWDQWSDIHSVNIATGKETKAGGIYAGTLARLHPSGQYMYGADNGLSPSDIEKYDIRSGPAAMLYDSPYHGDYPMCGNLWFTEDSKRMVTRCATVLRTSEVRQEDMTYNGTLGTGTIVWLAHSQVRRTLAVLRPETEVQFYGDEFLGLSGKITLPPFPNTASTKPSRGRLLFWNAAATKLYVLLEADPEANALDGNALYTIAPDAPGQGCTIVLGAGSGTLPAAGGFGSVVVTAGSSCTWQASSNASWLTITSGGLGFGAGAVTYSAQINPQTVARTATITVGTQSFVVTQAAGSPALCGLSLNALGITVPNNQQRGTLSVTSSSACTWIASSSASWVELYPLSGSGNGSVSYTIYPNFSSVPRSVVVTIGDKTLNVSQAAGSGTADQRFVTLLYFNLLGRFPSATELTLQVAAIQASSRAQLAVNLFNSAEFNMGGRFVAGLYVGLLNRDAEYTGYLFQRNAMITGAIAQSALVSNFMASAEYALRYGNPSNSEFVRLLYRYILLREPGQSEVDFHVGSLQAGMTRVTLASNFLNTPEFRQGTQARLNAFLVFGSLLMRDPSPVELAGRIGELQAGKTAAQLVTEIVQSTEFVASLN